MGERQLGLPDRLSFHVPNPCHGSSQIGDKPRQGKRQGQAAQRPDPPFWECNASKTTATEAEAKEGKDQPDLAYSSSTLSMATRNLINMVAVTGVSGAVLLGLQPLNAVYEPRGDATPSAPHWRFRYPAGIVSAHLAVARMFILSGRLGIAFALVAVCLGTRTAHAQAAPVTYWIPGWPVGLGGNLTVDPSSYTYGNFPSFDGSGTRGGGFSYMRYNFPNGWFVGTEGGGMGLSMNGINQDGAFGNIRSLYYEGVQFGYNFQNAGGLPLTVYAGFNTLKYNAGIGSPFASFDPMSSTLPGYLASNVSLSLGFGYTQQSGRLDSDINSLSLPGASPFSFGGRR